MPSRPFLSNTRSGIAQEGVLDGATTHRRCERGWWTPPARGAQNVHQVPCARRDRWVGVGGHGRDRRGDSQMDPAPDPLVLEICLFVVAPGTPYLFMYHYYLYKFYFCPCYCPSHYHSFGCSVTATTGAATLLLPSQLLLSLQPRLPI